MCACYCCFNSFEAHRDLCLTDRVCFHNTGLIGQRWFPLLLSYHGNCHGNDKESCSLHSFHFFVSTLEETLHSVDKRAGLIYCVIHPLSHLSSYRKRYIHLSVFPRRVAVAAKSIKLYSKWVLLLPRNGYRHNMPLDLNLYRELTDRRLCTGWHFVRPSNTGPQ